MRNKCKVLSVLIVLLHITGLCAQDAWFMEGPPVLISMDLQGASLKDVLKIFSIQSGLNFIASEAVQDRKITLYLDSVPLTDAMNKIFKANNLSYELDEEARIFIVKDWGAPKMETITKIYTLKYRAVPNANFSKEKVNLLGGSAADLVTTIRQVMSDGGKINEDASTNSLIITDIPSVFGDIEEVIARLDVPQTQVLLEVEIIDVSKDVVDSLGLKFGTNPVTLNFPGSFMTRGAENFFTGVTGSTDSPEPVSRGTQGALTLGHTYVAMLDFLRTQTDTKYLARPRILTLNNETAEISITKDEIVERKENVQVVNDSPITTYEYKRATELKLTENGVGIVLRVTPQVNLEANEILMVINPEASTTSLSTVAADYKDPEVKTTKSVVKAKDGETIVLGGLIHTDTQVIKTKVPILGDLPLIGALFRHKDQTKDMVRELLVFITPRVVKDSTIGAPVLARRPTLPVEREQSVRSSTTDRQAVINTSLNKLDRMQ